MIAALADDLTGTAEIGGSALRYGLSTEIHLDGLLPSDAEVVVIDANTRSSSELEAATIARRIATDVARVRPELLYKKVDSVLRGHVAAELLAVRDVCRAASVLLVNANPHKGRTVASGKLLIKQVPVHLTSFADDPEHPCRTSVVRELLRLDDGQFELAIRGSDTLPERSIIVGEVASEDDLAYWAQHWQQSVQPRPLDHSTDRESIPLVAGGGEFFEAILKAFDKQHSLRPDDPMTITQGSLLIRGSMVSATSDWPEVAFGLHGQSNEVADRVQSMLQRHARVALRGDSSFHEQPGEHLTRLIEVAKRAIVECQPTVVWIEGGRTASRLVRACGWNRLTPIAVHGDGVVRLRVQGTTAPELVLKPGSYAWPKYSHLPPRVSGG